jgi:hypothetical protein
MISLDTTAKGVSGASRASKSSKKEESKRIRFTASGKARETGAGEGSKEIADIAPMLFLQEVNEYDTEQGNLEEFGKKALSCLRDLQLALMRGELKERHLHNIKDALKNNTSKFNIPELASIAEELTLRMEVEIAKIEMNKRE